METQAIIDLDWAAPKSEDESDDDQGPPVAFLVCRSDEHPLYAGDNLVGRGPGQDVTFPEPTVSDTHALITCSNDEVTVKDLKSSNGTFVESWPPGSCNFEKVPKRATVRCSSGCSIRFGTVDCVLDIRVLSNETQALDLGMYMPSSQSPEKGHAAPSPLAVTAPELQETQPLDELPLATLPSDQHSSPAVDAEDTAPVEVAGGGEDSDAESEATLQGNDTSMQMDLDAASAMATVVDEDLTDRPGSAGSASRRVSGLAALIDSDDDECRSELSEPIVQIDMKQDQDAEVPARENQELLEMFDEVEENPISLDDEDADDAENETVQSDRVDYSTVTPLRDHGNTSPTAGAPDPSDPSISQPSPELIARPSADTSSTPATLLDSASTLPTITSPNRYIIPTITSPHRLPAVPVLEHKTSSLSVTPALKGMDEEPGPTNMSTAEVNIAEQPTVDRRVLKNSSSHRMALPSVPLTPVSERQPVVLEDMISPLAAELQCGVTRSPAPVLTLPGSLGRSTGGWLPKKSIPESVAESPASTPSPHDAGVCNKIDTGSSPASIEGRDAPQDEKSPGSLKRAESERTTSSTGGMSGVPVDRTDMNEGDKTVGYTMQSEYSASSTKNSSPSTIEEAVVPKINENIASDIPTRRKNTRGTRVRGVGTVAACDVEADGAPSNIPAEEDNEPLNLLKKDKTARGSRTRATTTVVTSEGAGVEAPSNVPVEGDSEKTDTPKRSKNVRSSRTRGTTTVTACDVEADAAPSNIPVEEDNAPLNLLKKDKTARGSRTRGATTTAAGGVASAGKISDAPVASGELDEDDESLSVNKRTKGARSARTGGVPAAEGEGEPAAKRRRTKDVAIAEVFSDVLPVHDTASVDNPTPTAASKISPDAKISSDVCVTATSRGRRKRGNLDAVPNDLLDESPETKTKSGARKRSSRLAADTTEPSVQEDVKEAPDTTTGAKSKKNMKATPVISCAEGDTSSQESSTTEMRGPKRRTRGAAVEDAVAAPPPALGNNKRPRENHAASDSDMSATMKAARSARNATSGDLMRSPSLGKADKGIRVLFTSIEPLPHLIRKIGAVVVEDATCASHVVTISSKQFKRTPKLMLALNSGANYVVGEEWLRDSAKAGSPLPLDDDISMSKYIVRDAEKEGRWNFNMVETLQIARGVRGIGVFTGISFYIADGVCGVCAPPLEEMKAIIGSGNGKLIPKSRLSVDKDPQRSLQSLVVIVAPPDIDSARKGRAKNNQAPRGLVDDELKYLQYSTICKDKKGKMRVYYPEFLFLACMRQRLDFTANFEVVAS